MSLCYVDYDQFEVGIMAAISSDPKMKDIYDNGDAYNDFSVRVFNDEGMRKTAKILFLSYVYGMSLENIASAVKGLGGNQKNARDYFSGFSVFEAWKESVNNEFLKNGRVSTIAANYLNRYSDSELTDKEKRISVNHVIQGTATYIFKRALLELSELEGVQILIPMHDAALFQHTNQVEPHSVVKIFEDVMTRELSGKVVGKASIEPFYKISN